jgi:hypothetical protein
MSRHRRRGRPKESTKKEKPCSCAHCNLEEPLTDEKLKRVYRYPKPMGRPRKGDSCL